MLGIAHRGNCKLIERGNMDRRSGVIIPKAKPPAPPEDSLCFTNTNVLLNMFDRSKHEKETFHDQCTKSFDPSTQILRRHRVVGSMYFNMAVAMHGALRFLETRESLDGQRQQHGSLDLAE